VVDPAGELLNEVGEVRGVSESGQRQLLRHALDRGLCQRQAPAQVLHRTAIEGSMPAGEGSGSELAAGEGAAD
jgi:hypothetical protein